MTQLDRVLGIVQAGGKGSRLDVFTRERAKPAMPFAGEFQLVDFALSCLTHSKIPDVWVDVANNAVVRVSGDRVTALDYKPESPVSTTVSTEITIYDAAVLAEALTVLPAEVRKQADDDGLGDFGERLVPWFVARGRTYAFPITSYWRDVGRPESYLGAHRDLLAGRIDVFDDSERPIRTRHEHRAPARFEEGCVVADSYVSRGAVVRGTVRRSVLGPGVVVGPGAVIEDSVVMADTDVEAGAELITSIVDERCVIGRNARVGKKPKGTRPRADDLCLIGMDSRVNGTLPPGSRLEPGTTA